MSTGRTLTVIVVVAIAFLSAGCGTPKEKSAPCKRPANLSGYAEDRRTECGPMQLINPAAMAPLAAIDSRKQQME